MGQVTVKSRTGQGHILAGAFTLLRHGHDVECNRMSDSSDVGVFILAADCEETEMKRSKIDS
jgi:hypothetical protein